jgi:Family of unknown function (DUF6627)
MKSRFMRITSSMLIASVLSLGLPLQSAYAGLVGTDKVAVSAQSQSDRERIRTFFDREDVRKALQTQGVDGNTAKARVDALTDQEVQTLAGKLDTMPAGGDIIGILFTVFVILLVTDILGFTSVFSFTHSIK